MYIYIYARDHNFSETSWFGFDGKGENGALAVVICTFLHIDHLVNNFICYGRFFLFVRLSWSTRSVCQQWLWHEIVHFTWVFGVFCFDIHVFMLKSVKIHWETPVKMTQVCFVLVFAVFCNVWNRAASW